MEMGCVQAVLSLSRALEQKKWQNIWKCNRGG